MPKNIKMHSVYKIVIFVGIALLISLSACKPKLKGAAQSQKNIEKKQEESKKEAQKEYEMALKRHMEIQSKDTQKRMKQSLKKSERLKQGKPEYPWYKRIFLPKAKKKKKKPGDF